MRVLLAVVLVASLAGCGDDTPAGVAFERVDLPAGVPSALGTSGETLLVGVALDDGPGLFGITAGAAATQVPLTSSTPYGAVAKWASVSGDGSAVVAVGGERGGAHGNVRWSVWTGSTSGLTERKQGFSTFGGYGAGDLVEGVATPGGPVVVGAWESGDTALDVAVWTIDAEHTATRRSSAGTALESSREEIGFPMSAAAHGGGVVIAGWQIAAGKQVPVVWRSASGVTDWTKTPLPDAGSNATADAIACDDEFCAITGRVDGSVAAWRFDGERWTRLTGLPPTPIGDREEVASPALLDGGVAVGLASGPKVAVWRAGAWTAHAVSGPTGRPFALATHAGALYLAGGEDEPRAALWRAPLDRLTAP
ncbi:hypothetical protein ACFPM7_21875 [Actinokineospora guangxiensis]|uniref:Uncharacterized protein n=1 Tax=Actinokineospora guangxiensis TaxID=1490288 RepID=A0ABW0EUF6_9PSEU